MESVDIFYQGHGIREFEHIEVLPDHTVAMIRAILIEKHGCEPDTLIFMEDHEAPLEDHIVIGTLCGAAGGKMHLHRCRHARQRSALRTKQRTTPSPPAPRWHGSSTGLRCTSST